jgi:hypothetical protein
VIKSSPDLLLLRASAEHGLSERLGTVLDADTQDMQDIFSGLNWSAQKDEGRLAMAGATEELCPQIVITWTAESPGREERRFAGECHLKCVMEKMSPIIFP